MERRSAGQVATSNAQTEEESHWALQPSAISEPEDAKRISAAPLDLYPITQTNSPDPIASFQ
jgi:hypothetical protein